MVDRDIFYMRLALNEAWKYQLLTYPNPAVGAVVVENGVILSMQAHKKAGTSHAEVLALLDAYEVKSGKSVDFDKMDAHLAHAFLHTLPEDFFSQCKMYITLEPCSHVGKTPSCASLIATLWLEEVFIAHKDAIHYGGATILRENGIKVTFGILEEDAQKLIEPFLIWQKRAFVLFKLAQSCNGKITGGTISSLASRTHMQTLRHLCDRLIIGGNTVRVDRPILDCRLINKEAPDIFIYSEHDNFDKSIPLFGVAKRDVSIGNNIDFLDKPSFVMVEGGEGMLRALQSQIDWTLIYQSPKMANNNEGSYSVDMDFDILHIEKNSEDITLWSKKR